MDQPVAAKSVSFIILPGFALTSFSLAVEVFSVANLISGNDHYRYTLCSPNKMIGETVTSSNGVSITLNETFFQAQTSDLIIIASYANSACYNNPQLNKLLKRAHNKRTPIAALSSGAFVLANAGLLTAKSCTLVPEHRGIFKELYPDITLQENLYAICDDLYTSAGGTATLDMLLYLIGLERGKEFMGQISDQFMQDRVRSAQTMQKTREEVSLRIKSACLGAAVELMQKHIEDPYPIALIADKIGTTPRNLEMVFRKHEQITPGRYYLKLRLHHAKQLILETHMPLTDIAQSCGFSSQSYFGKCFREEFDHSPASLRKSIK
jgi:transcriptional regulator GlxA family with amidase domain